MINSSLIQPDWPCPKNVRAVISTRRGGTSGGPFASLNLGDHVGDAEAAVAENRRRFASHMGAKIFWLSQVHGVQIISLETEQGSTPAPIADGAISQTPGIACCVMTADCLPLLLCNRAGTTVAAIHCGWKGLASGIVAKAVAAFPCPAEQLLAYLGPAISQQAFEVGADVVSAFREAGKRRVYSDDPLTAFKAHQQDTGKYWADLYGLARMELQGLGLDHISGGDFCTFTDSERFYSYRREGVTGRMASAIWLTA